MVSLNISLISFLFSFFFFAASPDFDHKLRWDMFRLQDLDCYNGMLTRLYKQELQYIVMRYETYRYSI